MAAVFHGGFYGGGVVLSRPDRHAAWRGTALPADSIEPNDRIRRVAS
jgi:hypothetical protein